MCFPGKHITLHLFKLNVWGKTSPPSLLQLLLIIIIIIKKYASYIFITVHAQTLDDCRLLIFIFRINIFKNAAADALLFNNWHPVRHCRLKPLTISSSLKKSDSLLMSDVLLEVSRCFRTFFCNNLMRVCITTGSDGVWKKCQNKSLDHKFVIAFTWTTVIQLPD